MLEFDMFLLLISLILTAQSTEPVIKNPFYQYHQPNSVKLQLSYQPVDTQKLKVKQSFSLRCDTAKIIEDRWFALDKLYHLAVSFSLVGSSYHLLANRIGVKETPSTIGSLTGVFSLGLAKEIYDTSRPDDHFSYRDLLFDLLGIGLGYLVFIR